MGTACPPRNGWSRWYEKIWLAFVRLGGLPAVPPPSMTGNRIASTTIMGLAAETGANGLAGRRRQTQNIAPLPDPGPGKEGAVEILSG